MILHVVVPPKDVIILDEMHQPLYRLIGPYNEDSTLRLKCIAKGGRPPPSVTWWRGMQLLDKRHETENVEEVVNELVIPRLARTDLNAELLCQVWNSNLTSSIIAAVFLDLNLKPLDVRLISSEIHYKAGQRYSFECRTTGSRPQPHISWWKDSILLDNNHTTLTHQSNISVGTLEINFTGSDHGKNLTCRVINPVIENSRLEDVIMLKVYYKPQVFVFLQGGRTFQAVHEDDDVYLDCIVKANPTVSEIIWNFQGKELKSNSKDGIVISNHSLTLKNVDRKQSGFYSCSARNSEGQGNSDDIELKIKYKPVCTRRRAKFYSAMIGELVRIECLVDADPDEVTFFWRFNNSRQDREILTHTRFGLKSVARFSPTDENDFGTFTCKGENSVGMQKEDCKYILVSVGPPDPVINCTLTNDTRGFLLVECKPGYDGGLTQHFQMEVYDVNRKHLKMNVTRHSIPVFDVTNLTPGTSLVLMVYAINEKGRSSVVEMKVQTSFFAERQFGNSPTSHLKSVLGILFGVLAGLVIMVITIVFVFRLKRNGREKDLSGEEQKKEEERPTILRDDDVGEKPTASSDPDLIPLQPQSLFAITSLPMDPPEVTGIRTFVHRDRKGDFLSDVAEEKDTMEEASTTVATLPLAEKGVVFIQERDFYNGEFRIRTPV
ncbi:neural cell adhesion molecule 2-like [Tachypleus tridentatus]|uniref:neural cell adhesion molecule 2-like n=1 Tax=Tachypleus tridentatus TaxID=6853 RepID=UPI003FD58217